MQYKLYVIICSMSKEYLKQLEQTGEYVFHGSPNGEIEELEPRQSTHVPDFSKPTEFILDGKPSIAATPNHQFAIFRALINGKNVPIDHTSGFGFQTNENGDLVPNFRVSAKEVLEHVKDKKGHVYVLPKSQFKPYDRDGIESERPSMEWRSESTVKPVEKVEVAYDDLPSIENIEVLDEQS
jgi:hypothetical protein